MLTRQELMRRYWNYYLMLEDKFIHTTQYVELDKRNYDMFSNEYALMIQCIEQSCDINSTYIGAVDNMVWTKFRQPLPDFQPYQQRSSFPNKLGAALSDVAGDVIG